MQIGVRRDKGRNVSAIDGKQDNFWQDPCVLTVSIHADPADDYPYFSGYSDETGAAAGEGFNLNLPLLVVALGVDGYRDDPSGKLRLEREDFSRMGDAIAALAPPKMFVLEGGYDHLAIGDCVSRVLEPAAGR